MKAALVISPFASLPRDAGHRRRVYQMTRLLADAGYQLTFVLLAFEDEWAWGHDIAVADGMRRQWDELIVVHAGPQVGRPPADGERHGLDEWWDAALEATLGNLLSKRFFDVAVVHNVWLSKAFDFVHPATTKVLETHDLFWTRPAAFVRIGAAPDFFVPEEEAELFGIARADIAVTIQEADAHALLARTPRRVVNVPFYEPTLDDAPLPRRLGPLREDRVSFGMLASANPFNIHGLNALCAALLDEVSASFAPVELVVGGRVGQHLRTPLNVLRLGHVADERGFYERVDFAVLPVFEGTGFKIKTADALALGLPVLAASHAAAGTRLDRSVVYAMPRDMAAGMADIALRRLGFGAALAAAGVARDDLRARAAAGEGNLLGVIARHKPPIVVDLRGAGALRLQASIGLVREMSSRHRVRLVLDKEVHAMIARILPLAVDAELKSDTSPLDDALPPLHANLAWDPAAIRLRDAWAEGGRRHPPGMLILADAPGGTRTLSRGRCLISVDVSDSAAIEAALMRLLHAPAERDEVVWAATGHDALRSFVLSLCMLRDIPFRGMLDGIAELPMRLPSTISRELNRELAPT